MKFKLYTLLIVFIFGAQACTEEQITETAQPITGSLAATVNKVAPSMMAYNNTKGILENGDLITSYDCPDSKFFPPIDIKAWDKTPSVNNRLPSYEETMNGTATVHYGEGKIPGIEPYNMSLPKLAYYTDGPKKKVFDSKQLKDVMQPEVVVVIQIVKSATDTVVSYRYLSGGCGGGEFHKFHFLSDEEVKEIVAR